MPASSGRKPKTSRFPAARIKKIMQMDEEVGKLASATPVMISKSLECFMQVLLEEAAKETRSRGSKKMTASHLKQTILTRPTLDFLLPVVASIPDPAPPVAPGASDAKPSRKQTDPTTRKRRKADPAHTAGSAGSMPVPELAGGLPQIGTWRRDPVGGGGSAEGGRGMFDDYEEDEDDY